MQGQKTQKEPHIKVWRNFYKGLNLKKERFGTTFIHETRFQAMNRGLATVSGHGEIENWMYVHCANSYSLKA